MDQRPKLHVDLDHVDRLDVDWLHVVLEQPTGVVYHIQCGGHSCKQETVEGSLVPVEEPEAYELLQDLFVRDGQSAPVALDCFGPAEIARLRAAVESVRLPVDDRCPTTTGTVHGSDSLWVRTHPIGLDESRLAEGYEAFVPVTTPFGRGFLVWSNSD